jgi:hypothetical protein
LVLTRYFSSGKRTAGVFVDRPQVQLIKPVSNP